MKVSAILILFLNIVASISFWAGNPPVSLDSPNQSPGELLHSDLHIQQSSILEVGDAITNRIAPDRPVVRSIHYFFKSQSVQGSLSSLSAICEIVEQNYIKTEFSIDVNLPAFLIIFPHHYFT